MNNHEIYNVQENSSDDELLRRIIAADATIEEATKCKKLAIAKLLEIRKTEISGLLKVKPEPYGDVNIIVGNHKCKVKTPKKVEWDQKILAEKHKEISDSGNDPLVYMEVDYKVPEAKYKAWPTEQRLYFESARTVKSGTVGFEIVEEKENG